MGLRPPFPHFRLVFAAAILSGVFGAASVRAADTDGKLTRSTGSVSGVSAAGKNAPKDWTKETTATCGMACRYHRANDNLTLQALYLVTKLKKVDDAIKDSKTEEARKALGAFCNSGSESLNACQNRYKKFQSVALLEIRQAIGRNEDTIAKLTPGRKLDGTVEGEWIAFEGAGEKSQYVPEVPTVTELEDLYLKGKLRPRAGKFSASDVRKWSQELVVANPKARYIEFQKVAAEGNPYQAEKSSYTLFMENAGMSGGVGSDSRSVQVYEASKEEIEAYAKDVTINTDDAKAFSPKQLAKEDTLSHEALTEARSILNSQIAGDLKNDEKKGSDRKPAAKPSPNPKETPKVGPDGKPVAAASGDSSREIAIDSLPGRKPSGYRMYKDDEKVVPPPELKNSRYIKYNIHRLMDDIEALTK